MTNVEIDEWINAAPDRGQKEFRQAVHIVIAAVAASPILPNHLVMKGGILLSIAHHGDRFTKDIDFSVSGAVADLPVETVIDELRVRLIESVEELEYDVDCRIQSHELRPPDPKKNWPTLIMRVGYAPYSDRRRHSRLMLGQSPTVVRVECSYNESILFFEALQFAPGRVINAYALVDVIAEKLRALIQQPVRDRFRRQDVYDLYKILKEYGEPSGDSSNQILESLKQKASSRNITVTKETLRSSEIKKRAAQDYHHLTPEIQGVLPPFEKAYKQVRLFYEGLPW